MKHRQCLWLSQALYLTPLAWAALSGCQHVAGSTFVLLEPPALVVDEPAKARTELAPTLGPGNPAPTPARLAQPTMMVTSSAKATSAAPGPSEASARSLLLKATACLEAKDFAGASQWLKRYLRINPDASLIRLQVAELCYMQHQHLEAQYHFSVALGEVVDPEVPFHCRLHAHSRLMELAQERGERFSEELHRGIGLLLLAEKRLNPLSNESSVTSQELLGKARSALQKACLLSPMDARPHLYLSMVWQGTQQMANAHSSLLIAQSLAPTSPLGAYEQLRLAQLAIQLR